MTSDCTCLLGIHGWMEIGTFLCKCAVEYLEHCSYEDMDFKHNILYMDALLIMKRLQDVPVCCFFVTYVCGVHA